MSFINSPLNHEKTAYDIGGLIILYLSSSMLLEIVGDIEMPLKWECQFFVYSLFKSISAEAL